LLYFLMQKVAEAVTDVTMRRFGAQYVLVFPGAGKDRAPEQDAIPFFVALSEGHSPAWLNVAARTPGVILYHCASCSSDPSMGT
jgi:hypothetical protein